MRSSLPLLVLLAVSGAQASWFSGSSDTTPYSSWDSTQLKTWLIEHNLYSPSLNGASESTLKAIVQANYDSTAAWSQDQYSNAQKTFSNIKDTTFDTWDESTLREWLVKQGVVSPSGPKEELVLLAKSKYNAYTNAASSYASRASATASTAVYGDASYQASKSISSIAAQATYTAAQALDDTKDYVYSTWDDNQLRSYLEEKGVIKTKSQAKRDELLSLMKNNYAKVADPVWEAWSDSYIREWLVSRDLIEPTTVATRADLLAKIRQYYYGANDYVWSTWTDSDLHQWLVDNGYIKSEAQLKREKAVKLVSDTYSQATSTVIDSYNDSTLRNWLIEHGYLRSDAQVQRDQLVSLTKKYYADAVAKGDKTFSDAQAQIKAGYLSWPDARLRAYLRQRGISEDALPTSRPGLLQETRIRWVQTQNNAESLMVKVRELINGGVVIAEEKLGQVLDILTGSYDSAKGTAEKKAYEAKGAADKAANDAKGKAYEVKGDAEGSAWEARQKAGEKVKQAGEKLKGEL